VTRRDGGWSSALAPSTSTSNGVVTAERSSDESSVEAAPATDAPAHAREEPARGGRR